ncbi:MAG: isocitrate/isopropylmalate dehydrogenase family protein [Coraliomargaritaceae bacterium]
MSHYKILLLPGDGIGSEVTDEAQRVLEAISSKHSALSLSFTTQSVGAGEYLKSGNPLPESAMEACREADAVLLGAMGLPHVRWSDGREMTPQIDLRERLDLFAGLRPIKLFHSDDSVLKGYGANKPIDFLIVRENTEGLFSGRLNKQSADGSESCDLLRLTRKGCERICRTAFEHARKRRKYCTLVDKANVLPSMVFFREIFNQVGEEFPDVKRDCIYVDAMALFLVQKPHTFDVMVTENMFGDILSDLAAGLVGGMGMAPSADIGEQYAIFQPSHGTAPDITGKGIANPIAAILSASMMLDWLGEKQAAENIESAVARILENPAMRSSDIGGNTGTKALADAIISEL